MFSVFFSELWLLEAKRKLESVGEPQNSSTMRKNLVVNAKNFSLKRLMERDIFDMVARIVSLESATETVKNFEDS